MRDRRGWHLAGLDGSLPASVGLEEAIALLEAEDAHPLGSSVASGAPERLPDGEVVPGPPWAGRIEGGAVLVEDADGRSRAIGPAHLVIIDAAWRGASEGRPLVGSEQDERLLSDLLTCGLVRLDAPSPSDGRSEATVPPAPGHPSGDATEVDAPAPDPWHQRVLRRLRSSARAGGAGPETSPVPADPARSVPPVRHPRDPGGEARIPVYAVWDPASAVPLSLGMITAVLRSHRSGALAERFEIRRPEQPDSFLDDLRRRSGPAVLLLSNYLWSLPGNLDLARRAKEAHPDLVVVHGGPSTPKYPEDAVAFLEQHGAVADVLVRGEGEATACELFDLFDRCAALGSALVDPVGLRAVEGVTFVDRSTGEVVRTPDRERLADLDQLPSPYLTGEFDHLPPEAFQHSMAIETNRGCPYGCSFCDWGSATMSRIRRFSLERVLAEIDWSVDHGVGGLILADANFGILRRDLDIAQHLARCRGERGLPELVALLPAKNTIRHLVPIIDVLSSAGIPPAMSLGLQTTDPATLELIDRSNISIDQFVDLAAEFRRRGLPFVGDLLVGMPGQTYESFIADLQFAFDHEIMVRTWPVQLLPNAPMNDRDYRARHGIVADERGVVIATDSFGPAERQRMLALRRLYLTLEVFGLGRHLARYLQWDHGMAAVSWMDQILDAIDAEPSRYPALAMAVRNFDLFPVVPEGRSAFVSDLERLVTEHHGIEGTGLRTVCDVQRHLLPAAGRRFPHAIDLEHDYVGYYLEATASLYATGRPSLPSAPLERRGPGRLEVRGDPTDLCTLGARMDGDSRDEMMQGDFYLASNTAYELESPLARALPWVVATWGPERMAALLAPRQAAIAAHERAEEPGSSAITVRLGGRSPVRSPSTS